jgi:hypothetical protein
VFQSSVFTAGFYRTSLSPKGFSHIYTTITIHWLFESATAT